MSTMCLERTSTSNFDVEIEKNSEQYSATKITLISNISISALGRTFM